MATFLTGKLSTKDIQEAMAHLNGLILEPTNVEFLELKSRLSPPTPSPLS